MNLTAEQEKVIKATDPKILCLSCAAAGKTTVLIQRINYLIKNWNVDPQKILAFTFTNQAAEEIKRRLTGKAKLIEVCTIHSYANKICKTIGIETQPLIQKSEFDTIIKKAMMVDKKYFPCVDHLFVDEVQDTSPEQFEFIEKIPAKNRFYCGDDRQFIYGFRGSTDKYIRQLAKNHEWKKYYLIDNFRNPRNIVKFGEDFLWEGQQLSPSAETHLEDGILEEDIEVVEVIIEEIHPPYGNWTFLCRTNREVMRVNRILNAYEIPSVCFFKSEISSDRIEELLRQEKVKIMTIHASKGLEFPNVVLIGAKKFNEEEGRISYVGATRAKKSLYCCGGLSEKKTEKIIKYKIRTDRRTEEMNNRIEYNKKGEKNIIF